MATFKKTVKVSTCRQAPSLNDTLGAFLAELLSDGLHGDIFMLFRLQKIIYICDKDIFIISQLCVLDFLFTHLY